jgi:hypothetical protein
MAGMSVPAKQGRTESSSGSVNENFLISSKMTTCISKILRTE